MAFECVAVKQEPDLTEGAENEASAVPRDQNGSEPEYINIKMEIDVPVQDLSTKSDLPEPATPPAPTRRTSWHVPITDEIRTLPEDCIQITIKEEFEDSDEDNLEIDEAASDEPESDGPASDDQTSDDRSYIQPSTSKCDDDNSGLYQKTPSGRGYVCQICKKTFANPGNVQRHLLLHTRETIKCDQCNGQFLNKIRLDRHIFNRHTLPSERVYACDVCEKRFKSSSNLMQHKKVHLTDKPHKCPICYRTFSFKTNLKKHQGRSRCKKPTGEPISCNFCEKVFDKEYLLKSHLRKHATDRPHSCEQCSSTFKYKSTLIRHMQLHKDIRPYSCSVCDKSFTHPGLIKPHMRVHTGEKPYQCQMCDRTFAHKHNMQRHMQRHDKIKHLVCDVCHKEFPRESRLKYHMRIHVNEKHFICHVCPKRFSHKQNVLRHYTRKHPGQTYSTSDTDASVALKVWDTIKSKYYDDEAEEILG